MKFDYQIDFAALRDEFPSPPEQLADIMRRRAEFVYAIQDIACHTLRLTRPDHPMSKRYEEAMGRWRAHKEHWDYEVIGYYSNGERAFTTIHKSEHSRDMELAAARSRSDIGQVTWRDFRPTTVQPRRRQ